MKTLWEQAFLWSAVLAGGLAVSWSPWALLWPGVFSAGALVYDYRAAQVIRP